MAHATFMMQRLEGSLQSRHLWSGVPCRLWQQRHRHHLLRAGGGAGWSLLAGHLRHLPGGLPFSVHRTTSYSWPTLQIVFSANGSRMLVSSSS